MDGVRTKVGIKKTIYTSISFLLILMTSCLMLTGCSEEKTYDKEVFQAVLQNFYEATYKKADLEMMKELLIEEYRFYFEQAMTMAEMDKDFYKSYKAAAETMFGVNATISIIVNSVENVSKENLNKIQESFGKVDDAVIVEYDIIFKGKEETTYKNKLEIAKVKDTWYMTSHLDLPIGRNVYAY